ARAVARRIQRRAMVRIQSPRAVRGWRSQSLDTRYYSRRWRRGGGSWCRHNFLRNNCRWFAGQSRAGVNRPVFKQRFPTEINQHTDNKYFGKRSHGNMTFPKSGTQRNREYADLTDGDSAASPG